MLDVGSYRNAINVLQDNVGAYPAPPRYRSLTPEPYGEPAYRGSKMTSYRSQQNLDGDWLSVPHSGTNNLMYSKRHRSQDLLDSDRMSRPSGSRDLRSRGYSHQDFDDDDFRPIPNGSNSRSVGFSQHTSANGGRRQGTGGMRENRSGGRHDFYPEPTRQSTSRVVYSGEREHRPRERVLHSEVVHGNPFLPSSNWDETGRRSSTRLVFDGRHDSRRPDMTLGISTQRAPEERQFLNDVQKELEFQRQNWKGEIEKMTGSGMQSGSRCSTTATKNSFVDTSGVEPRFKAFVDVSEFPPSSVTVNVDKLTNKVVIEAEQVSGTGSVAKTFTQKVQLPRFADDSRLSARMNRDGILKVEVPLIYYFPEQEESGQKTKSFVYEVRKNQDGSKVIEILVKPGQDLSIDELRVELNNDKLIVSAERSRGGGASQKSVIKSYTLPENADVQGITSNVTRDGCLTILVPIYE